MSPDQFALRPASPGPISCKICDGASALFGVVDLNRPCLIANAHQPPLSGASVYYRRCAACGFLFTDALDDWSVDQFKTHIYNDDYHLFDPDYQTKRPTGNAGLVTQLWDSKKDSVRLLDFGGGNDVLCATLRSQGFPVALTYDPMVPEYASRPDGKFNLITCFETLEHVPDPVASIERIVECTDDSGVILYSTLTQPPDLAQQGMSWWYIGPRNGHISIFTKEALAAAWGRHGFKNASLNDNLHLAYRTLPEGWQLN